MTWQDGGTKAIVRADVTLSGPLVNPIGHICDGNDMRCLAVGCNAPTLAVVIRYQRADGTSTVVRE